MCSAHLLGTHSYLNVQLRSTQAGFLCPPWPGILGNDVDAFAVRRWCLGHWAMPLKACCCLWEIHISPQTPKLHAFFCLGPDLSTPICGRQEVPLCHVWVLSPSEARGTRGAKLSSESMSEQMRGNRRRKGILPAIPPLSPSRTLERQGCYHPISQGRRLRRSRSRTCPVPQCSVLVQCKPCWEEGGGARLKGPGQWPPPLSVLQRFPLCGHFSSHPAP